jgi:hypothetical protein
MALSKPLCPQTIARCLLILGPGNCLESGERNKDFVLIVFVCLTAVYISASWECLLTCFLKLL